MGCSQSISASTVKTSHQLTASARSNTAHLDAVSVQEKASKAASSPHNGVHWKDSVSAAENDRMIKSDEETIAPRPHESIEEQFTYASSTKSSNSVTNNTSFGGFKAEQMRLSPGQQTKARTKSAVTFTLQASTPAAAPTTVVDASSSALQAPTVPYLGLTVEALENYLQSLTTDSADMPLGQLLQNMTSSQLSATLSWASKRRQRCKSENHSEPCLSCTRGASSISSPAAASTGGRHAHSGFHFSPNSPADAGFGSPSFKNQLKGDCGVRPATMFVVHYSQQSVRELVQGLRAFVNSRSAGRPPVFWVPFLCTRGDRDSVQHGRSFGHFQVQPPVSTVLSGSHSPTSQSVGPDRRLSSPGIAHANMANLDEENDESKRASGGPQHSFHYSSSALQMGSRLPFNNALPPLDLSRLDSPKVVKASSQQSNWHISPFARASDVSCDRVTASTAPSNGIRGAVPISDGKLDMSARIVNLVTDIGRIICVASDVHKFSQHVAADTSLISQCCLAWSRGASIDFAIQSQNLSLITDEDGESQGGFNSVISALLGPKESRASFFNASISGSLPPVPNLDGKGHDPLASFTVALGSTQHNWLKCKVAESIALSTFEFIQSNGFSKEDLARCPSGLHVVNSLRDCGRLHAACNLATTVLEARMEYSAEPRGGGPCDNPVSELWVALAASAAGTCFRDSYEYDTAIEFLTLARTKFRKHLLDCDKKRKGGAEYAGMTEYLESEACLGEVQHLLGDVQAACDTLTSCLNGRQRHLGQKHRHTMRTLANLAAVYHDAGDLETALKFFQQAVDGLASSCGKDDQDYLSALMNIAVVHKELGHHEKAQPIFEEAVALYEKIVGEREIDTLCCYTHVIDNLRKLGNGDDTIDFVCNVVCKLAVAPSHASSSSSEWQEILMFARRMQQKLQVDVHSNVFLSRMSHSQASDKLLAALRQYDDNERSSAELLSAVD